MPKHDLFIRPIDLTGLSKGEGIRWLGQEKKIVSCDPAGTKLVAAPGYLEGLGWKRSADVIISFMLTSCEMETRPVTGPGLLRPNPRKARGSETSAAGFLTGPMATDGCRIGSKIGLTNVDCLR